MLHYCICDWVFALRKNDLTFKYTVLGHGCELLILLLLSYHVCTSYLLCSFLAFPLMLFLFPSDLVFALLYIDLLLLLSFSVLLSPLLILLFLKLLSLSIHKNLLLEILNHLVHMIFLHEADAIRKFEIQNGGLVGVSVQEYIRVAILARSHIR